jgi:dolichol-phosphate mannosyltransferase
METTTLTVIVPVYNEGDGLEQFHAQLSKVLDSSGYLSTVCYVNDGSTDSTGQVIAKLTQRNPRVVGIELSRNFGHQAALTAGLDMAQGDLVITMDGDGQHPPELIPRMIEMYQAGCDIVLTQRINDRNLSLGKRLTSDIFYRLVNWMGDTQVLPGSADYRLMSRSAVDGLKRMGEYHRFVRGMVAWMGYRTAILPFAAPERIAGKSQYSTAKMIRLARDAIFSFSLVPLWLGIFLGIFFLLLACAESVYVLSLWFWGNQSSLAPGWSSLMFMLLIVGGILMVLLGLIGVYVGLIFQEVKHRPIYLVRQVLSAEDVENRHAKSPIIHP